MGLDEISSSAESDRGIHPCFCNEFSTVFRVGKILTVSIPLRCTSRAYQIVSSGVASGFTDLSRRTVRDREVERDPRL